MKSNKVNMLLIAFSIIVQRLLFQSSGIELYQFPFASSLMIFTSQTGNILLILYAFIPIPFILFEFSGCVSQLTEGYGKMWVIRAYKKEKLFVKTIVRCIWEIFIIAIYQVIIFAIAAEEWKMISHSQILLVLLIYYLGMITMVILQCLLELCVDVSYANLICNTFFVGSLFLGTLLLTTEKLKWFGVLLFPNMMFGTRNGIIQQAIINLDYRYPLVYMICLIVGMVCLAVFKFRKKDVY